MVTPERVRWGLLSTARINERLIPAMHASERSSLVGVASRDKAKAEAYARQWKISKAFGSYEAMLADPEIDVVYISLPNSLHAEWSVKAADAHKHVLCEKPLALTVDEVDRMTEAARRNGVVMQEAAMYRFHPQTQAVREMVQQGAIGQLRTIQAIFSFTLFNKGDVRLDPKLGGGSLWDIGSYPVSFARSMVGANPTEVAAHQVLSDSGVDLTFSGQLYFANGVVAQFTCSFQAIPRWEVEMLGSAGRIILDQPYKNVIGQPSVVSILRGGAASTTTFGDSTEHLVAETLTDPGSNAYLYEVEAMAESILEGKPPVVSLEDSRGNIATIVALYTAAREHTIVKVQ